MSLAKVVAYVDGFNLYYGLRATSRRRDLWLDIASLMRTFIDPSRQELVQVHYFTAAVHGDGRPRQDTYLKALQAHTPNLTVHLGHYMHKTVTCRNCSTQWPTYEEKESDVALAVQIVKDAAVETYDRALLVSADSDMCPAVRAARAVASELQIVAVFPPKRTSAALKAVADHTLKIYDRVPRRHQLPYSVTAANGAKYTKPDHWA